jgi:hypothetical protein
MAYAQLAAQPKDQTAANESETEPQKPASDAAAESGSSAADDAERAKARAKIWTPPGA